MVNIIVSGVPVLPTARCLQLHGAEIYVGDIACAVSEVTGIPEKALMLLSGGHAVDNAVVVARGADECAFLEVRVCRALPGGKGGFGAMLRGGNASKKTTNFGACRDLSGRRIRDLEREQELASTPLPTSDGRVTDAQNVSPSDSSKTRAEENDVVDMEEVKLDLQAATEVAEDAVAEGIRAAKRRRKKDGKGAISKKKAGKRSRTEVPNSEKRQAKPCEGLQSVGNKRAKLSG